jgi:hypothetical protein
MEIKFERETCSRCGGSGRHSYCSAYGSVCFKCNGKGVVLSRKGKKQFAKYMSLMKKPVDVVKVGDYVRDFGKWKQITAIEQDPNKENSLYVICNGLCICTSKDSTIESVKSEEERQEFLRTAIIGEAK